MDREIFCGLKVLDFTWIIAGPWAVRYFAEYGADVVHVETKMRPDSVRMALPYKDGIPGIDRSGYFVNYHSNQWSLSINLRHPEARKVINRLVEWADVVTENFSPGVMESLGFGYDALRKIKPDIILISLSGFGQTGPRASLPATGNELVAMSGFSHLTGWPDLEPSLLYGGFTDCGGARLGAIALIAALLHKRKTGQGQHLDLSQYEAALYFLRPILLDYVINKRIAIRNGNRLPRAAPQGVYRCKGEDRWCAITVFAREWEAFCNAIGNPQWVCDPKFTTLLARKKNENELDKLVEAWTIRLTPEEVMVKLQEAGVRAGVVKSCQDIYNDPQLEHRQYFVEINHPVVGNQKYGSQAFKFSKTQPLLRLPAPCIGQHNEYVCTQILGMSDIEFAKLVNDDVLE